jgi:hypothetical protein
MAKMEDAMKAVDTIGVEIRAAQGKLDYAKAENERLTRLNAGLKDQIDATLAAARQEVALEKKSARDEFKRVYEEKEKFETQKKEFLEQLGAYRVERNAFDRLKESAENTKKNADESITKCAEFIRVVREMAVKL